MVRRSLLLKLYRFLIIYQFIGKRVSFEYAWAMRQYKKDRCLASKKNRRCATTRLHVQLFSVACVNSGAGECDVNTRTISRPILKILHSYEFEMSIE